MSKSFLKVSEAYTKLGLSGGGTSWIRKSELIATGKCDTSLLEKYGNNDFVVDDDIVKASLTLQFSYSGGGNKGDDIVKTLPKTFNPSKDKFLVKGRFLLGTTYSGINSIFYIYKTGTTGDAGQNSCIGGNLEWNSSGYFYSNWRKSSNVWVDGNTVSGSKSQYINFEISYDGTTLVRKIWNDSKSVNLNHSIVTTLYNVNCNAVCFNGSPFYGSRSCYCDFQNFEFYY